MFRVTANEIRRLQGSGGVPFTLFVDDLIRATAAAEGVPDAEIRTNLKTTTPDGGVDTEVRVRLPHDPTGRFRHPTLWQYKASGGKGVSAAREIGGGKYAADLIRRGYAYRLCICDDLAPRRSDTLRRLFADRIGSVNPDAPDPEIVTASDLAVWANRFPGVVIRHLRPGMPGRWMSLDAWGRSVTAVTPQYVSVPEWGNVASRIREHADLGREAPEAVLSLRGEAGVGKTRLVYETLAAAQGAAPLVIYMDDGDAAIDLAYWAAKQPDVGVVLIVDECGLPERLRLAELLRGVECRVRLVAITNSDEMPPALQSDSQLASLGAEVVQQILERNFPGVPADRRRGYAELSGGYVRFAAELCRSNATIELNGYVGPVLQRIEEYLCRRIPGDELRVLESVSLLTKVGARGDVAH
jgi:hypothetical protein